MHILSPHNFHIPVMGIAFTIDSPLKVAHFGITSALSIIEDNLIETMRKYYYQQNNETYVPIGAKEENARSRRITDYLNLMNRNVQQKIDDLKSSAFDTGSELVKYFEMLPENHLLKERFEEFMTTAETGRKKWLETFLRKEVKPGSIEVNIMTKVDKNNADKNGLPMENGSDALQALKGYAESDLENSAVIFSAGMNPRLYNYLEGFRDFDATAWGQFRKKVIIKVSDYRSALIQGKFLAKKGIWVSEFRIESGLNCGGHAFATEGLLLGPILEEFRSKREELAAELYKVYNAVLESRGEAGFEKPHPIRITVQGGIGTAGEASFLTNHYHIDSTGWGTPFLLCPEATTVEEETLQLLSRAGKKDVVLSKNSPLGVRFNYLKNTSAEKEKEERISRGAPGSPCTEKYLVSNTEFTKEPICTASKKYQKLKLEQIKAQNLSTENYKKQANDVLAKECLCIGLSNAAAVKYEDPFLKNLTAVTICPGPNISNFSKVSTLKEMTDHIYGRSSLLSDENRPHMFIKELQLYVDHFKEQLEETEKADKKIIRKQKTFLNNLFDGVSYYRSLGDEHSFSGRFTDSLKEAEVELKELEAKHFIEASVD